MNIYEYGKQMIIKEIKMKGKIKKSDLRTGMVVETVNGKRYIVFLDTNCELGSYAECHDDYILSEEGYMCLGCYDENLMLVEREHGDIFDIIKVSSFAPYGGIDVLLSMTHGNPIFDKNRPIVMTVKEIEKALGYKISINIGNITYYDEAGE